MNRGVFLICGDDDYLVETAARERIRQILPDPANVFGLEIIDGRQDLADEAARAVNQCIEALQTQGFFGAEKVVWLRDVSFLTGGARVAETIAAKAALVKLVACLKDGLPGGTTLLITAPKVLRSSVFFKACQKTGEVEDFGNALKSRELTQRAAQRVDALLKAAGVRMAPAIRDGFLQRVGFDTRTIVQEVEKLLLYVGDAKQVSESDVNEITSIGKEAEAWDLCEAVGLRDARSTLATLRRLSGQKGIGIRLAAMLEKNVREWLALREAYERKWVASRNGQPYWCAQNVTSDDAEMLASLPVNLQNMPGWLLRKKLPQALKYSLREWRIARYRMLEVREKLVSTGLPEMYLLETTLLRIIGSPSVKTTRRSSAKVGPS